MTALILIVGGSVLALVLAGAATVSLAYWGWRTGCPPHPSTRRERRAVIELLREAGLGGGLRPDRGTVIYELGCGWGGLARRLARAFPDHRVEAWEASPVVAAWAWLRGLGHPNLQVRRGDFMEARLRGAAAVVCYLMIEPTQRLAAVLDRELGPGTPVVSVVFQFRGRTPCGRRDPGGWQPGGVHLYAWPARGEEVIPPARPRPC